MFGSRESLRNGFSLVKAVAFEKGVLARKGSCIPVQAGADVDSLVRLWVVLIQMSPWA